MRVVRDDGRPVTPQDRVRCATSCSSTSAATVTFGIGWIFDSLWPLGEKENRALHDLAVEHARGLDHAAAAAADPPAASPRSSTRSSRRRSRSHFDAARRIQDAIGTAVQPGAAAVQRGLTRGRRADGPALAVGAARQHAPRGARRDAGRRASSSGSPSSQFQKSPELIGALREQLVVQKRIEGQLQRYDDEMERIVVELDTVRANIVSVSASGDLSRQEQLAETRARAARRDERRRRGHGRGLRLSCPVRRKISRQTSSSLAAGLEQLGDEVRRLRRPGARGSRPAGASRPSSIDSVAPLDEPVGVEHEARARARA